MQFRVTRTDNGKHSDEKIGLAFAEDLISFDSAKTGKDDLEGRMLANKIADVAAKRFREIADREHKGIADNSHAHLASSLDADASSVDGLVADAVTIGKASSFKAQFDDPDVLANIRQTAAQWVRTAQHMHRDWFARHGKIGYGTDLKDAPGHNPADEHVMRWKALHDGPTPEAYRQALHEHAIAA